MIIFSVGKSQFFFLFSYNCEINLLINKAIRPTYIQTNISVKNRGASKSPSQMEWHGNRSNIAMFDRHLYSLQIVTTNVAILIMDRERFNRL